MPIRPTPPQDLRFLMPGGTADLLATLEQRITAANTVLLARAQEAHAEMLSVAEAARQAHAASQRAYEERLAQVELAARLSGQKAGTSEIEQIARHAEHQITDLVFNEANNASVASGSTVKIVSYALPQGALGILRWFATGLQNLSDFDTITWQLVVGGMPVYGFDAITGPIATLLDPMPMFWPVFQGQRVEVLASNPVSSGVTVSKATALVRGTVFMGA